MDDPAAGLRARARRRGSVIEMEASGGCKDVVEALSARIRTVWIDGRRLRLELPLSTLWPAPGVVEAVTGRAVEFDVVAGSGHGQASSLFGGIVCGSEGALRVEDAPRVSEGRAGGDNAVRERAGRHVEVAEGDDEAAGEGGGAEEL